MFASFVSRDARWRRRPRLPALASSRSVRRYRMGSIGERILPERWSPLIWNISSGSSGLQRRRRSSRRRGINKASGVTIRRYHRGI